MSTISNQVSSGGRRMTVLGVITIILGLCAIAAPLMTGLSVVTLVGLIVIAAGVMRMIWAFGAGSFGRGLLAFAIGGLILLCGIALVTDPLIASGFLTLIIAFCLIADGVAEILGALRLGSGSGRGWMLVGGIVSIVLGVMIWRQYPLSGGWAIGILLGVRLLFAGIAMMTGGSAARKIANATS
jgi:uncharacterized membrane protein HdeD (DUF308 family)